MKVNFLLFLFFFFVLLRVLGSENNLYMEKISVEDGLFSNRIYKTYRDNSGYLWIAGINGLAKYDGFYVVNYTEHSDSLNRYIRGNRFYDVIQDNQNTIWVASNAGLHQFDATNNTFLHVAPQQISNANFLRIINDSILAVSCTNKRNFYINYRTNVVTEISEISYITSAIPDNSGTIWTSTSTGCVIYDDSDTILNFKKPINDICFTPNGDLYLATNSGLSIVPHSEIGKDKKTRLELTETSPKFNITYNKVTSVVYSNNSVWVGTRKGLNRLDLDENGQLIKVQHFFNQPNNSYSLCNNQINDIYSDNEGIIWISTHGGLNKIDLQHLWFHSFRHDPEDANSLHDNIIFPINGDTLGNIWFGSNESGAAKLNVKSKQFSIFNRDGAETIKKVHCIYTDKKNNTWLAADSKLYYARDNELERAKIIDGDGLEYSVKRITAITQHPNGNYWMGINNELVEVRKIADKIFQVVQSFSLKSAIISVYVDNYQRIWAGSGSNGIFLNAPEICDTLISFSIQSHPVLKSNEIQEICHDSKGNLWFGSANGLYRVANDSAFQFEPENISFTSFFKENGLTDNYISGILPGENGILWLGSWKGIMKYDPACIRLCRFTPYTFSDGLVDEKFNRNGAYLDEKSNTYYFGTTCGVNYFNPLKELKSRVLPRVLIMQIQLNGDLVSVNKTPNAEPNMPVVISKIQKRGRIDQLHVQFGSSSLLSPNKQVFAWKLEGKDEQWTYSRNRELLLKDIGPGKYTLKIRAASKNGKLGVPVFIAVRVVSYWGDVLKTIIILIIGGISFWRIKKKKLKEQEKHKENKYAYSKLTDDKSANAATRLSEVMNNDKPYLQPDLTAVKLAKMVGVSQGELSQILNEYLNTRFYEYVNKYRVEEFVRILHTVEAEKLTINALAENCGFSSKSTFYRAFNNEKGMTPAQYAKTLKIGK